MDKNRCYYCGSTEEWEERRIEYVYQHQGHYLIVPNMPVQVCPNCHAMFYPGPALEAAERMLLAIQNGTAKPNHYIQVPVADYETISAKSGETTQAPLLAS